MEKVIYNVVYNRKNRLLQNGKALIQIEAYLKGKKRYFSTKIYITPDQWDWKHRRIKGHPNQITLNKQVKDFISELENAELNRRLAGKPFSLDFLVEYTKGNIKSSFIDFSLYECDNSNLQRTTKVDHKTTFRHLSDFRNEIRFDQVTFELLSDFEKHLKAKGLHQNTIKKMFAVIRKYVNLAIDKEYIDLNKYPFRKFRVKSVKSNREYLTPEELESIEKIRLKPHQEYLQLALDKFLFAVYTGLRFSDVNAITTDNLILNDGNEWLILEMQKVKEQVRIPVYLLFEGKALDIIYKYAGPEKVIFPFQNNQVVNLHVAEIARIAKIKKRVTFHVARHTQATYLLYKGVNITTVQKLLGHKRLETTQIYGKVMDITLINELQNVTFSR